MYAIRSYYALSCKNNTPCLGVFDAHHMIAMALESSVTCDMSHCAECSLNNVITSYSIHYTKLYDWCSWSWTWGNNCIWIPEEICCKFCSGNNTKNYRCSPWYSTPAGTWHRTSNRITSYNVCYTKLLRCNQLPETHDGWFHDYCNSTGRYRKRSQKSLQINHKHRTHAVLSFL